MSQDIFQTKIDQTFEGCKGVIGIADDIVIFGQNEEDHDANLHAMVKRGKEAGIRSIPTSALSRKTVSNSTESSAAPMGSSPIQTKFLRSNR